MKTKLFLLGLLSFFYVNSQVIRLVELPVPTVGIPTILSSLLDDSGNAKTNFVPTNDECDNPIELTVNEDGECGTVTGGTLSGATDSGIEAEAGTADDDVWFSFVATNTIHKITLQNVSDDDDMVMELMEGDCGALTLFDYIDDPNVLIVSDLTIGSMYYLRVYSYTDSPMDTTFEVCVGTPPAPPANDECENAISLTVNADYLCGVVTSATLESATDSGLDADIGTADDDVWFTFTATAETHKIAVNNIQASGWDGFDLAIEVFSDNCGGTLVESSDYETVIIDGLVPETVYYVRVYSYYDTPVDTTFDICIGTPPDAPANDDCSGAVALTVNSSTTCEFTTTGTLQSATDSGVDTELGEADDDVWYSFVATSTSHLVSLSNVEGDVTYLVFEVLDGVCDGQSSLKAVDSGIGLVGNLEIGTTYYIRVYSYYDDNNPDTVFDLCVSTAGPAPANDNCDAAVALTVNEGLSCENVTSGTLAFSTDSGIPSPTGTADDDVWYSFIATSSSHKISALNVEGDNTDLVIQVFEGDCDGVSVGISDPETFALTELSEGMTYYVRVFTYGSSFADTTFDLCVTTLPAMQPNDECEDAIVLTVNTNGVCESVTTASVANATDSGIEAEEGEADDDVWFSFVATGTSHKVSIPERDNFETISFEVFEGACGGLNLIGSGTDYSSPYINDMIIGETYYVRAFSYTDVPVFTTFDICVTQRQDPPANDECEGAISLNVDAAYCDGVLNNGTNLGATDSGMGEAECFNYGENDVWFSFTVPENVATVDISTDFTGGTLTDTEIALYSGSCGDLTEMDCDQDGGETVLSNGETYNSIIKNAQVNVGETYYVRVSGYSENEEGTFCLEISTNQTLSTENFTKNTVKVYPNPVKNTLNLSNTGTITDVAIFNLLGQQVITKVVNANNGQIDMSHLSAGAYLVKVTADNAVQTFKIIKE